MIHDTLERIINNIKTSLVLMITLIAIIILLNIVGHILLFLGLNDIAEIMIAMSSWFFDIQRFLFKYNLV